MPTVGWIHEGAWDAYLSGTERVPDPNRIVSTQKLCPFCTRTFPNLRKLDLHLGQDHAIARPILTLAGMEPAAENIIRAPIKAADVLVANATTVDISLDGGPELTISLDLLGEWLSGIEQGTVDFALKNSRQARAAPVSTSYRLQFRIATVAALEAVEDAFADHMISTSLRVETVSKFLRDSRCQGSGLDYTNALAEYVLGVLVKERPDGANINSPLRRYRELFGASLEGLAQHHRPLPRLLCRLMKFALNDFPASGRTGFDDLDLACSMMRGPDAVLRNRGYQPTRRRPVCPIDHGTGRILDIAARLAAQKRWSPVLSEECRQVAEMETLDILDRQKALALWSCMAWRFGAREEAVIPLAQLQATYPFNNWATKCLEMVNK